MMLNAWLAQPKGQRSSVVCERVKKRSKAYSPRQCWASLDKLMTNDFFTKIASAAPFPVAFCCKLTRLELGFN